jgi:hypothetical protein
VRRFKLRSLRAGLGPVGAEVEIKPADRDHLHPLFVVLRDKRALLDAPQGREDSEYVTRSIETIRDELTTPLKALDPDSAVAPWIETLRSACREYLDAVAETRHRADRNMDFALALAELRASFRQVAEQVARRYDLPAARELAQEMDRADHTPSGDHELASRPTMDEPSDTARSVRAPSSTRSTHVGGAPQLDPNDPLITALGDSAPMVRFQAMAALRDHLHAGLLPVIEQLLTDSDDDIRQYAVEYYAALRAK